MTADPEVLRRLREADLQIVGRFADASNLTILAQTPDGLRCVYKPTAGERPLWDFPAGTLGGREVAMFELSQSLGWGIVPETVLRSEGPFGAGACQRYIEQGPQPAVDLVAVDAVAVDWRLVIEGEGPDGADVALVHRDSDDLRRMAALDAVANNADRKGGHVLVDPSGAVWGIDHGLTFHSHDKLRTVLWGFAGEELGERERLDLQRLAQDWTVVAQRLREHLAQAEVAAARTRLASLLDEDRYPSPGPGWPRLPWPPL